MADSVEEEMTEDAEFPAVIELNVGGRYFSTTLLTLTKHQSTMLGAMFSGKFKLLKDKNGCYFLDADGDSFEYILRYLRLNELPPVCMMEKVYKDAIYFGLGDLISELEMQPVIMTKLMKDQFYSRLPGFKDVCNEILHHVSDPERMYKSSPATSVVISGMEYEPKPLSEEYDLNHVCECSKTSRKANVEIKPWRKQIDTTVDEYLRALKNNFEDQGFVAVYHHTGNCFYSCSLPPPYRSAKRKEQHCSSVFYTFVFHWTKS